MFIISAWPQSCNITSNRVEKRFIMMGSLNGNIWRVTGPLCGNSLVTGEFPHKRQWRGALTFSLICAWIYWFETPSRHYDVTEMYEITSRHSCLTVTWPDGRCYVATITDKFIVLAAIQNSSVVSWVQLGGGMSFFGESVGRSLVVGQFQLFGNLGVVSL